MHQTSALDRALKYLTIRPRTEKEIMTYLDKKGYCREETEKALEDLKRANYINDERFAEGFSRSRAINKFHGRIRLRRELIAKGVRPITIDKAMDRVFEEIDQDKQLQKAIDKWVRIHGKVKTQSERKKLHDHLFRLGYEPPKIFAVLPEAKEQYEE